MLPMLIHEAAVEGLFHRLASRMLITATGLQQSISQGMEMSVMCAEDYPLFPKTIVPNDYLLGTLMEQVVKIQCEIWPRGGVPADYHEPVTGSAPVLLLSGDAAEQTAQLARVLEGYTRFHDVDARELNLVEALRTLRMLHHAAWIARRWDDPAFPAAFPWFDSGRYWDDLVLALREQLSALQEPPLQWRDE